MDTVRRHGTVSRANISQATGLSPATVTGITGKLMLAGYLEESGALRTSAGRPSQMLMLSKGGVRAIGVRLSVNVVDVVALNLNGEVVMTHTQPWQGRSPDDAAAAIENAIDDLRSRVSGGEQFIGVGVAVSGIVNHSTGFVTHSGSLNWENVPLREILTERLGVPVEIDNYVNAYALGLLLFNQRASLRDVLLVNVGASVGMSLVVGGRIYRGADGTAGGLAHTRVDLTGEDGRACHCGNSGCVETVASQWGIESELARRGSVVGPESLAADGDDPDLRAALAHAGSVLGRAVANAAKMFGPHQVLIAFASNLRSRHLVEHVDGAYSRAYGNDNRPPPEIEIVTADDTSWAYGAGCEVLAGLFQVDIEVEPPHREPT
ncbi:ROK family protein [Haloactinopolyspora alba]|nr:ROK family protein [Haloactinopolyspora alba]